MDKLKKFENIFKALANDNRLKIIDILSCGELCVCDIMEGLKLSQPTISHHLKILEREELLKKRKNGKWSIYKLNNSKFDELVSFINLISTQKESCICKDLKKFKCKTKKDVR